MSAPVSGPETLNNAASTSGDVENRPSLEQATDPEYLAEAFPTTRDRARAWSVTSRLVTEMGHEPAETLSGMLRQLPPDVAIAIVHARAKADEAFFEMWSASIRENRERDDEAAERYALIADHLNELRASRAQTQEHVDQTGMLDTLAPRRRAGVKT